MRKTPNPDGVAHVEFTLGPAVGATSAAVCGEWNGWDAGTDLMERRSDGGFALTITLPVGRTYRFRYLLDGHRWENDWQADAYVPNDFGEEDSVVDLTDEWPSEPVITRLGAPPAPAKAAPAKKATPAKKAAGRAPTVRPAS